MILVEIRPRDGSRQTIAVHAGMTVVRGLDAAARRTWATDLARALQGETAASVDLEVEVDGQRTALSPDLVRTLGLADAATGVTVFAVDLPGAAPAAAGAESGHRAAADPDDDPAADVATAEAEVARLTSQLAEAEVAATAAVDELRTAGVPTDGGDPDAEAVAAAESRASAARSAASSARQQLAAAEEVVRSASEAESSRRTEVAAKLADLERQRAETDAQRQALVVRLQEAGRPGDPKSVEQALAGLRRLRSVKPKPSAKAVELADRWAEARAALEGMPQPPQPPEWLVTPALAALQEAREALAEAESGSQPDAVDPVKVEALDRAHREVLEAEKRAMKKGSRANRKRLDAAHELEQQALSALGVKSYGEYLQRIAPLPERGTSTEERIASAKAARADAEAVWEELHGGQASPEWTMAKEHQASLRAEAFAMLGENVDDDELEDRLRSHQEMVVDAGWAEQALVKALQAAGAAPAPGVSAEEAAEAWLADAPALLEAHAAMEAELSEVDGRLTAIEEQLAEHRAEAGVESDPSTEPDESDSGPLAALRSAAREAGEAEAEAERALAEVLERRHAAEAQQGRQRELAEAAEARRNEVDRLRIARAEAEQARDEARRGAAGRAPATASGSAKAAPNGAVDLSGVVGMEAEAYLLARVSALRGAPGGPLPLVLDGDALTGLSEGAARRVRRLLGRLAGQMQVVVLADDDDEIATWAEGLGDQAAVRQVAR